MGVTQLGSPVEVVRWAERPETYTITEADVGKPFKGFSDRRDVYYCKVYPIVTEEQALAYFDTNIAPYIARDLWDRYVADGHEPKYVHIESYKAELYTYPDEWWIYYKVEIHVVFKHASPITLLEALFTIIVLVIIAYIVTAGEPFIKTFFEGLTSAIEALGEHFGGAIFIVALAVLVTAIVSLITAVRGSV